MLSAWSWLRQLDQVGAAKAEAARARDAVTTVMNFILDCYGYTRKFQVRQQLWMISCKGQESDQKRTTWRMRRKFRLTFLSYMHDAQVPQIPCPLEAQVRIQSEPSLPVWASEDDCIHVQIEACKLVQMQLAILKLSIKASRQLQLLRAPQVNSDLCIVLLVVASQQAVLPRPKKG